MKAFKILNISCQRGDDCAKNIMDHLELELRIRLQARNENDTVNGHVSISHKAGSHKVWVFIYDTDGIHESDVKNRRFLQTNIRCKRPTNFPTSQEVEDHISNAPIPLRARVIGFLRPNP